MAWSRERARFVAAILCALCSGCESDDGAELSDAARAPIETQRDAANEAGMRDAANDAAFDANAVLPMNEASAPDAGGTNDAGVASDADDGGALDARVDSAAPPPAEAGVDGVGVFRAQYFWGKPADAGTAPTARVAFTVAPLETRGCTSKMVAGCVVESCSNTMVTMPQRISAGAVTAKGSRGTCEWNVASAATAAPDCLRQMWEPQTFGERVQLTASGGTFPKFDLSLSAPPRMTLLEPTTIGPHARSAGFKFRWGPLPNFSGVVEVWLGRPAVCSASPPPTTVSARCAKNAQDGELTIAREVFAELSEQRCLGAIASARSARAESIGRFVLHTELSATFEEPYLFAAPGETCGGTHAACNTFSSDEAAGCTRHGCRWQAGACSGTPHACAAVELPECMNSAAAHRGCMRATL